jgi:hypothetical protein
MNTRSPVCRVSSAQSFILSRIGIVKEVGQNLMISVASDASYKKDGEWMNRANWIEHTGGRSV